MLNRPGALPWSQPRLHRHTGLGQAEPGQRAPLPGRGGSTLVSGARGHLPDQSLVQSGLWVRKPPCCALRSERDLADLKVTGNVVASGPPRGNGGPSPPDW